MINTPTTHPFTQLHGKIQDMIGQHFQANEKRWLESGTINDDLSLHVDSFPTDISFPLGMYFVLRHLRTDPLIADSETPSTETLPALEGVSDTGDGASGASLEHTHGVPMTSKFNTPGPGDRVLIAWLRHSGIAGGQDPIIIGIIDQPLPQS